ncbi:homologous recombination OB-fold protein [Engystomops pustulosus]|uniref:homologous recombination OB-fold protein n=1 Tax=Engystomops pustulosus TaxID=76066 RepID=UPI003AFA820A
MALRFQNLFSGSEDFDDEDFLSVLEDTDPSNVNREPTSVNLRPIPKTNAEDSGLAKGSPAQQVVTAETLSAPSSVQDVDDDELLSLCSELEAESSNNQHQASAPHPQFRRAKQTLQQIEKNPTSSPFQLRPSRSNQDLGPRHCLSDITAQSQHLHFNSKHPINHNSCVSGGGNGPFQSPVPTAKRPCLRTSLEPQPVTPVRGATFTNPRLNSVTNMSPTASGLRNVWQTGPGNSHPVPRTPLSSPCPPPSNSLQTPVVTNHLIQLMTAANKTPKNLPWETPPPKQRRFPGPAGLLPQQGSSKGLDEILVSTPHTPSHGACAKLHSKEGESSRQPEEQFIRGPWAAMKTELSLDESDPTCFLHTYSVVMVLRKAALKQLPRNKVPRMAVALKMLTPANGDASAVFRDPTGEIQGTVHHLLLEERESELKIGSVLLLQQVGVFSPSHRNHYLNVTPSNLVKIYPPLAEGVKARVPGPHDDVDLNSNQTQSPPLSRRNHPSNILTSPVPLSVTSHTGTSEPPVSHRSSASPYTSPNTPQSRNVQPPATRLSFTAEQPEMPQPDWDQDDLDSLLCDLPED